VDSSCSVELIQDGLTQKFHRYALETSRKFLQMTPPAVAEMKLLDFIDDLISWATSSISEEARTASASGGSSSRPAECSEREHREEKHCKYPAGADLNDGKMYRSYEGPDGVSPFTDSSDGLNPKLVCWALRNCVTKDHTQAATL